MAAAVVVRRIIARIERNSTIALLVLIALLGIGGVMERRDRVATNTRNVGLLEEQQELLSKQQASILQLVFRVDDLTDETHRALCGIKADYRARVRSLEKILRSTTSDPVKVFGLTIPRSSLQVELRARRDTLETLAELNCRP